MLKIETTYKATDKKKSVALFRIVDERGKILCCGQNRRGQDIFCTSSLKKAEEYLRIYSERYKGVDFDHLETFSRKSRKHGRALTHIRKSPERKRSNVQDNLKVCRIVGIEYLSRTIVLEKMKERIK